VVDELAPKLAFITLGCPKNEVDTNLMRRAVENAGYFTHEYSAADLELASADVAQFDALVVNTCSFIQEATEASIEAIFDALNLERKVNDRSESQEAESGAPAVIVAGCIVNRYANDLRQEMPEVAGFVKVGDTDALLEILIARLPAGLDHAVKREQDTIRSYEYLRIADGCNRKCSFCTIPDIRGSYVSQAPDLVIKQAKDALSRGARELVVIAQDIGRYGSDLGLEVTLLALLESLVRLPGLKRLRLMYLQPEGLSNELIEFMAENEVVVPYLEIPLQHINPRILRAMGRNPRDVVSFAQQVRKARTLMPELAVRTTLIAGFPDESEEEFEELCNFVEEVSVDYLGVFPYSPEEGTRAAELPGQLTDSVRLERAQIIRDLADQIAWQRIADRVGQSAEVLIEDHDTEEGVLIARAAFQAPDIDGIVRVEAPAGMAQEDFFRRYELGSYLQVRFTDAILYDLDAVIIPTKERV
jgi:ribosomal protein S12 methylthiotransferase